ncbi:MAG: HAD-IB family hydrolase [Rubrivivax sp.]|nr:HAD-IB family hydrolase [Rubrivivax sp.]
MTRLAIFDLDHTLIDGDSDQLWCEFLMDEGLLERAGFAARNREMEQAYRAGSVDVQAFCDFYIGTLAGRSAADWQPLRQRFWRERVRPCIFAGTAALINHHRTRGDLLLLSTATNRYLSELTAAALGFRHLIATECEVGADGRFSGRAAGVPNMRAGKVTRLHDWLAARGLALAAVDSCFYSDSMNDLALLEQVNEPVVTNGDETLRALAAARGWRSIRLHG